MAKGKTVEAFLAELQKKSAIKLNNTLSKKVLSAEITATNRPKRKGFNEHGTNIKNIDAWVKAEVGGVEYLVVAHTPKPRKGDAVIRTFYKKAS